MVNLPYRHPEEAFIVGLERGRHRAVSTPCGVTLSINMNQPQGSCVELFEIGLVLDRPNGLVVRFSLRANPSVQQTSFGRGPAFESRLGPSFCDLLVIFPVQKQSFCTS